MMSASVTPNPAHDKATISYTLAADGVTEVLLYDLAGRLVQSIRYQHHEAGTHAAQVDLSGIAAGMYYITVRQNDRMIRQGMIVSK